MITKHAVEAHVGAIFAKLDLPGTQTVSRRVTATLLFLADTSAGPSVSANGKKASRREHPRGSARGTKSA